MNEAYYLNIKRWYCTISPNDQYKNNDASGFRIGGEGMLINFYVKNDEGGVHVVYRIVLLIYLRPRLDRFRR